MSRRSAGGDDVNGRPAAGEIVVRALLRDDLDEADRVFRVAFGTFMGVAEPEKLYGDAEHVRSRWRAAPEGAFAATRDGEVIGSVFVADWGSVGLIGPLTVRPDCWDQGVAHRLLDPARELLAARGVRLAGLFTFAQSPKHLGLYQRYGFWPRSLTALMEVPVQAPSTAVACRRLSELDRGERAAALAAARELTDAVYPGLDVSREIRSVLSQGLGDTVLVDDAAGVLRGLAVCHIGPGSEAGCGVAYVKFAAVLPGRGPGRTFERLVDACHDLAGRRRADVLQAGVNLGRRRAYCALRERAFRPQRLGVTMHCPDLPGYDTPGRYVLDDWR